MTVPQPSFGKWMGSMWLYTTLRFGLFFVLWALLWILGVSGLLAALLALILSVPLSYFLLAKPRATLAAQLEARVNAHRVTREHLDHRLAGDDEDDDAR